jgi:hypothetical protein
MAEEMVPPDTEGSQFSVFKGRRLLEEVYIGTYAWPVDSGGEF